MRSAKDFASKLAVHVNHLNRAIKETSGKTTTSFIVLNPTICQSALYIILCQYKNKIMESKKVWLVTGASKGLGLTIAKQLLNQGYRVAATSRNLNDLARSVSVISQENFLGLEVDLKSEHSISNAVEKTIKQFGRIDVVLNNAGYGLTGSLEELTDEEARENFDINVFGSLNVIRQVMPYLRAQQSGHIFNISSIGGFTGGFPGFGIYCATKFAVQGFTDQYHRGPSRKHYLKLLNRRNLWDYLYRSNSKLHLIQLRLKPLSETFIMLLADMKHFGW